MLYRKTLLTTACAFVFATNAYAEGTQTIRTLPDKGTVTLHGIVDKVKNEHEFTLRDDTGTINVDMLSQDSVMLKKGAEISVTGEVDKNLFGKDINASKVVVNETVGQSIGKALESATGVSIKNAQTSTIQALPDEGLVKISGTVDSISNEKEFTLKDSTGSIDVDITSEEAAALQEGTHVTVIGYVDKGALGKDINATSVIAEANHPDRKAY